MPYENIYCHICEGLIRTEEVPGTESPKIPSETHDHLEDCVKELVHQMDYINVRLLKLEGEVNNNGIRRWASGNKTSP